MNEDWQRKYRLLYFYHFRYSRKHKVYYNLDKKLIITEEAIKHYSPMWIQIFMEDEYRDFYTHGYGFYAVHPPNILTQTEIIGELLCV